jgi:tellurite resistance protein
MFDKGKLAALVAVAQADGTIDERERKFLAAYCIKHGLSTQDLADSVQDPGSSLRDLPFLREEKMTLLKDMLRMSVADDDLGAEEKETAATLAGAMGLTPDDLDIILST